MSVKVRMRCHAVQKFLDAKDTVYAEEVLFYATETGEPNSSWSAGTPNGSMRLYLTNSAAFDQFSEGSFYDFPVEAVVAS